MRPALISTDPLAISITTAIQTGDVAALRQLLTDDPEQGYGIHSAEGGLEAGLRSMLSKAVAFDVRDGEIPKHPTRLR